MKDSEGCGESFVVASQAAEADGPGEASLHQSSRQQHGAALGLGMLEYFQLDTMLGRPRFRHLSRVALIHICLESKGGRYVSSAW